MGCLRSNPDMGQINHSAKYVWSFLLFVCLFHGLGELIRT